MWLDLVFLSFLLGFLVSLYMCVYLDSLTLLILLELQLFVEEYKSYVLFFVSHFMLHQCGMSCALFFFLTFLNFGYFIKEVKRIHGIHSKL